MTDPVPLTPSELARIWRWQGRMFAFYGIAIALLALAGVSMLTFGNLAWVRRLAAWPARGRHHGTIPRTLPALRPAPRLAWATIPARAMPGLWGRLRTPAARLGEPQTLL
jgi:hypothetical protein